MKFHGKRKRGRKTYFRVYAFGIRKLKNKSIHDYLMNPVIFFV